MKRLAIVFGAGALALVASVLAIVALVRVTAPPAPTLLKSVEVVDRDNVLLRPFALADGRWRLAATPERVDRRYIDMLISYEDQRFRGHWGIENALHWVLDVVMNEDQARARKDHAPENLALLRRFALNIIKRNKDKGSNRLKFKRAGWDNRFLKKLFSEITA